MKKLSASVNLQVSHPRYPFWGMYCTDIKLLAYYIDILYLLESVEPTGTFSILLKMSVLAEIWLGYNS